MVKITAILSLFFLALTPFQPSMAAGGQIDCPPVMVNLATGSLEELGKVYRCYSSASAASNAEYSAEDICVTGPMKTVSTLSMKGDSNTQYTSPIFKVKNSYTSVYWEFYAFGDFTIDLKDYTTGKTKRIVSSTIPNSNTYTISEEGLYYITARVREKQMNYSDPTLDPAYGLGYIWSVNVSAE